MNKDKIIKFIIRFTKTGYVDENINLFENGCFNSLFMIQLVLFIEKEFNITVENEIIGTDKFNSVASICRYIERFV